MILSACAFRAASETIESRPASLAAMSIKILLTSEFGSCIRIGTPLSPPSRRAGVIGISPRNGMLNRSAARSAPPRKRCQLFAAAVADEIAHVLDDADDRNHDLVEHRLGPDDVGESDVLRRGDKERGADFELLGEGDLNVAGSWRHIDDEIIELAP